MLKLDKIGPEGVAFHEVVHVVPHLNRGYFISTCSKPFFLRVEDEQPKEKSGADRAQRLKWVEIANEGLLHLIVSRKGQDMITVGRSDDCDLVIPKPTSASRCHARINKSSREGWRVMDLLSANGTSVEGKTIAPNSWVGLDGAEFLSFGDYKGLFLTAGQLYDLARRRK